MFLVYKIIWKQNVSYLGEKKETEVIFFVLCFKQSKKIDFKTARTSKLF